MTQFEQITITFCEFIGRVLQVLGFDTQPGKNSLFMDWFSEAQWMNYACVQKLARRGVEIH